MKRGCLLALGVVVALLLGLSLLLGRVVAGIAEEAMTAAGATAPRVESGLPGTLLGGAATLSVDRFERGDLRAGASTVRIDGLSVGGLLGLTATPAQLPDLSLEAEVRELVAPITTAGRTVTFAAVRLRGPLEAVTFEAVIGPDQAASAFAAFLPGVVADAAPPVRIDGTSIVVTDGPQAGIRLDFLATAAGFRSVTPSSTSDLLLPDGLTITNSAVAHREGSIVFSGTLDLRAAAAVYGIAE
jgi:hypothetical protein